ncbi:MAG: hypothetical protein U0169_27285 [Polyangiaceae bacterium]
MRHVFPLVVLLVSTALPRLASADVAAPDEEACMYSKAGQACSFKYGEDKGAAGTCQPATCKSWVGTEDGGIRHTERDCSKCVKIGGALADTADAGTDAGSAGDAGNADDSTDVADLDAKGGCSAGGGLNQVAPFLLAFLVPVLLRRKKDA